MKESVYNQMISDFTRSYESIYRERKVTSEEAVKRREELEKRLAAIGEAMTTERADLWAKYHALGRLLT